MLMTQPEGRINFNRRQVDLYSQEIEGWKETRDTLKEDCRFLEDLSASMNFHYGRIKELDLDIQEHAFIKKVRFPVHVFQGVRGLFSQWLGVAKRLEAECAAHSRDFGTVDDLNELRANIRECCDIVTPDSEFFSGEKLDHLASEAIDEHRAGLTEPLSDGLARS